MSLSPASRMGAGPHFADHVFEDLARGEALWSGLTDPPCTVVSHETFQMRYLVILKKSAERAVECGDFGASGRFWDAVLERAVQVSFNESRVWTTMLRGILKQLIEAEFLVPVDATEGGNRLTRLRRALSHCERLGEECEPKLERVWAERICG